MTQQEGGRRQEKEGGKGTENGTKKVQEMIVRRLEGRK
jgi:hypothetical protein